MELQLYHLFGILFTKGIPTKKQELSQQLTDVDCHSSLRQDRAALIVSNPSDRIFKGDDSLRSGMLLDVSVELSTDW